MHSSMIRTINGKPYSCFEGRLRTGGLAACSLAASILICGCVQSPLGGYNYLSTAPAATPPASTQASPFAFSLKTDQTSYIRSQVVHATFTVTNPGPQSGGFFPVLDGRTSANGRVVWQLDEEPGYAGAPPPPPPAPRANARVSLNEVIIGPGQSAPVTLDWDQRDLQGNYVPPGRYLLEVWLNAPATEGSLYASMPYETTQAALPVTITIQDTPVPAIPAAPVLTAAGGSGVSLLSWTAASGAAGYHLYRDDDNGASSDLIGATSAAQLTFSDSTVQPGNQYGYAVRAFNIAGIEGPDSNTVNVQM